MKLNFKCKITRKKHIFKNFFLDNNRMPKNFKSIQEEREYGRTRKQIQKINGESIEIKPYIIYSVYSDNVCCYVGMTSNLNQRIKAHKNSSKNFGSFFYDYVKDAGGWDKFVFKVAFHKETTKSDILIYENYFIKYLNPICNGVYPYISNADYNRIACQLGNELLPELDIKNISYRKNTPPMFVNLNPIIDSEETRTYVIYNIECMGKKYIGQTSDYIKRMSEHKENSKMLGINILYDHIYSCGGWENSNTCVVKLYEGVVTKKQALMLEAYYIKTKKPELNSIFPYISNTDLILLKKFIG